MLQRSRTFRFAVTFVVTVMLGVGMFATPAGAISVTRAEDKGGGNLRVEGEDAVANATIFIDGVARGTAEGNGDFRVEFGGFSSSTCVIEVSDGSASESVSVDGCTPSGPTNQSPSANAGPDQTVIDADDNGSEQVSLNGGASSDPDGSIVSYSWTENGATIATGANPAVTLGVGAHSITLTVTDDAGASANDIVVVTVDPAPTTGNQSPTAAAGADFTVVDIDSDGAEDVTLDGSASTDPDGSIVSYEWTLNGSPLGGTAPSSAPSDGAALALSQETIAAAEYQARPTDAGLQAPNRENNIRTYFESSGVSVVDRTTADSLLSLDLARLGRDVLETVPGGDVVADGSRVEIRRPGITEWYVNRPSGLEQGFTIDERPAGSGDLVLELAVDGASAQLVGERIRLHTDSGRVLGYDKLITNDATGAVVPSHLDVADNDVIRIVVNDSDALYPLVIDPVVTGSFDHMFESNVPDPPGILPIMFGATVTSAGDVNGDGFDDIAIGAPIFDGGVIAEGAVFVFLGGPNGPVGTNPASAHQVIVGDVAGGQFSVVDGAGDVNGDGFDDIVVGAPHYDSVLPGTQLAVQGAVFVFHGSAGGITATSPAQADQALFGNQLSSAFGSPAEGAGDVNGDGFADIVVNAPNQGTLFPSNIPPNDASGNYGVVLVYHGGPNGITGTGVNDADAKILPYVDTGEPLPPVDDQISFGKAAGDVNGDGFDDIVAGGTQVTLYLGGPNGITAQNIFGADSTIQGSPPLGVSQSISGAGAGLVVDAAGDVNGDGFADLVVANPGRTLDPLDANLVEGAAYVVLGGANGYATSSLGNAHAVILGEFNGERLGMSIAGVGDIDNDGFADVAIGALFYAGSLDSEGAVYLFRGSAQGVPVTSVNQAHQRLEARQSGAIRLGNNYAFDIDGAGDVNGDGFGDVIVGKGFWDAGEENEGATFVYHGGSWPANPNQPPVADAGPDRVIVDVDNDWEITFTLDGTASFDPDGSIVSYEWFEGDVLLGTGATLTTTLGLLSTTAPGAGNHHLSLVVTDDDGARRGDIVQILFELPPTTQEFNEGFANLNDWTTTGNVTLGDEGAPFPNPPHVLMQGNATLERTFPVTQGTTGVSFDAWLQGNSFSGDDTLTMSASFDGGPFIDFFTMSQANAPTSFVFFNNQDLSVSQWPAVASTVTLRYTASLTGAQVWIGTTLADSIQAPTGGASNMPPTANAGPEVTVVDSDQNGVEQVTLNGGASSDLDGTIVSYEWREGGVTIGTGPSLSTTLAVGVHTITLVVTDDGGLASSDTVVITVENGSAATLTTSLPVGVHAITLTVTDDQGATGTDIVVVTVQSPTVNQPPTANAGPDQTYPDNDQNGVETVTIDGGASSDSDGSIASWSWTQSGTVLGSAQTLVTDLALGSHMITLTVTDDQGATDTDVVVITVEELPPNGLPVADAGPDQLIIDTDGDTLELVTFDGTGSTDPDNDIVSYFWTKNGTPFGNSATFTLTQPIGVHTVVLTVTDSRGSTSSDTVVVTIEAAPDPGNQPPVADAGPDLFLDDPDGDGLASAVVDGTGSFDPDGSIGSYEWRLNGTLVGTAATQGIPFPVGVNTLELTVRDDNDAVGTDIAIVTVAANQPPTANAGPDQTVTDNDDNGVETVTLSAAGSADADGSVAFWAWRIGGTVVGTNETLTTDLTVGIHDVELIVTDDGGASGVDVVQVTVAASGPPPSGGQLLYVSSNSGGNVGGVSFADEDILSFDPATGTWEKYLDGSDIGLSGAGARDVDAFHVLDDGSVLLSIQAGSTIPDVGSIDDSDIVRFVPTSTGANTAGSFEMYFDGSDVGLTTNGEDVDGVTVLANGDLVISTSGGHNVSGVSGADEDLLRFTPTSLGVTTAGNWSVYFDGSDIALNNSGSEDIGGVAVDTVGDIHFTTRGSFTSGAVSGTGSDIVTCAGPTLGSGSACAGLSMLFDGSGNGFGSETMDALHIAVVGN